MISLPADGKSKAKETLKRNTRHSMEHGRKPEQQQ
jgi:hypothetical protein